MNGYPDVTLTVCPHWRVLQTWAQVVQVKLGNALRFLF
jgi:hypothetical protein